MSDREQRIRNLYLDGMSFADIGMLFDLSEDRVKRILGKGGRPEYRKYKKLTKEQIATIRKLYKKFGNGPAVSREIGICASTIYPHISDLTEEYSKRTRYTSEQRKDAKKLRKKGWTYERISRYYGIPFSTVANWCK